MKKVLWVFLWIVPYYINAIPDLAFVDDTFDHFINRVVTNKRDQQNFKIYFERLTDKIAETDDVKKRATRQYLYQIALDNLQKKHAAWYDEINQFFADVKFSIDESFDPVRAQVRQFLRWYGAYEEYLTAKMLAESNASHGVNESKVVRKEQEDKSNLWVKTKDFAVRAKNKIAGAFKRKTVANA